MPYTIQHLYFCTIDKIIVNKSKIEFFKQYTSNSSFDGELIFHITSAFVKL